MMQLPIDQCQSESSQFSYLQRTIVRSIHFHDLVPSMSSDDVGQSGLSQTGRPVQKSCFLLRTISVIQLFDDVTWPGGWLKSRELARRFGVSFVVDLWWFPRLLVLFTENNFVPQLQPSQKRSVGTIVGQKLQV